MPTVAPAGAGFPSLEPPSGGTLSAGLPSGDAVSAGLLSADGEASEETSAEGCACATALPGLPRCSIEQAPKASAATITIKGHSVRRMTAPSHRSRIVSSGFPAGIIVY